MKPPIVVERVLYESGYSWNLRSSDGTRMAAYLSLADAELIAALVNKDHAEWLRRKGWPEMSDTNEVESQCVE